MRTKIRNLSLPAVGLVVLVAVVSVGAGSVAASAAPERAGPRVGGVRAEVGTAMHYEPMSGILGGTVGVATTLASAPPSVDPRARLLPVSCLLVIGATGTPSSRSGGSSGSPRLSATSGAIVGFVVGVWWMTAKADSRSPLMGMQYEAVPIGTTGAGAVLGWVVGKLTR
jgi:hypothetical protein